LAEVHVCRIIVCAAIGHVGPTASISPALRMGSRQIDAFAKLLEF